MCLYVEPLLVCFEINHFTNIQDIGWYTFSKVFQIVYEPNDELNG